MKRKLRVITSFVLIVMMILTTTMYQTAFAASKLGKVKGVKATVNVDKKTIKLTWKKIKGATGYVIYKNTKKKFKKKHAKNVKKAKKTYKKLKVGKTYYFKIRAFKKTGSGKKYGKATVKKVRLVKTVAPTTAAVQTNAPTTGAPQTNAPATQVPATTTKPVPENQIITWKDGEFWYTGQGKDATETLSDGSITITANEKVQGNMFQLGSWRDGCFSAEDMAKAVGKKGLTATVKIDNAQAVSGTAPTKLDIELKLMINDVTYSCLVGGIAVGGGAVQVEFPFADFTKTGDASVKMNPSVVANVTNIEFDVVSYESYWGNSFKALKFTVSPLSTYGSTTATTKPTTTTQTPTTPPVDSALDTLLGMSKKTVGDTMTSPLSNDTYTLKFIDEFTGTSINTSNWSYYTRNYNSAEQSVNRKENVIVENGLLNIYGKKENQTYTGDAESWETPKVSNLTGGAINSLGKKEYKYGRLEIYCKIPYSRGMWPAFWTMGTQRGWPWGGEIDIMEFVGGVDEWGNYRDDEYHCGLHWADPNTSSSDAWGGAGHLTAGFGNGTYEIPGGPEYGAKLNDEWHVCGLEWNETTMYTYCDDDLIGTIDITQYTMREAFHQSHYMILNLVMGGSWAGNPSEANGTVFPQVFQVDWVKVWQK